MAAALAFVDTETTGLDPDRHEIWEVGLILRDGEGAEVEYEWQLPVDLGKADPVALDIGQFWLAGRYGDESWASPDDTGDIYRLPWNSTELSEAVGVDRNQFEKHTALGDARWAKAIYDAVMLGTSPEPDRASTRLISDAAAVTEN